MPRIKRWFPVSHDINQDPEVWQFTDKFGDRALRVWLEMLSIADRNSGLIGLTKEAIVTAVSYKCRSKTTRVALQFDWITTQGWVHFDQGYRLSNYAKYHRTEERDMAPTRPDRTRPDLKDPNPATPAPLADPPKRKELDPRIKAVADRVYKSNPLKFQRLIQWIKQAEKYHYPAPVIAETLERFELRAGDVVNWYGYLDKMIEKIRADYNRDQSVSEHERHKAELREVVKRA